MNIKIELFSEWQCGSGLAGGADVDLLAIKDKKGFPFIPGRTLKGLLADAAAQLTSLAGADQKDEWQMFKNTCFGKQNDGPDKTTESGCFFVANAELGAATRKEITRPAFLFRKRAGTAIEDSNGQAMEHTLRRIEVAVPVTLYAVIEGCPDNYRTHLDKCLQWVKHLGTQRNRGFGRCRISEVEA